MQITLLDIGFLLRSVEEMEVESQETSILNGNGAPSWKLKKTRKGRGRKTRKAGMAEGRGGRALCRQGNGTILI